MAKFLILISLTLLLVSTSATMPAGPNAAAVLQKLFSMLGVTGVDPSVCVNDVGMYGFKSRDLFV
jgi:hypothetical protein